MKYTKDKTKTIKIRVSEEEYNNFKKFADKQGVTISDLVRKAINASISRHAK